MQNNLNFNNLVDEILKLKSLTFFQDLTNNFFVEIKTESTIKIVNIDSIDFQLYVIAYMSKKHRTTLSAKHLHSLMQLLISHIKFLKKLDKFEIFKRCGEDKDFYYFQLCQNKFLKYGSKVLEITDTCPVKFVDLDIKDQIIPEINLNQRRKFILDYIKKYFNLVHEDDIVIFLVWVLYAFKPRTSKNQIHHPILILGGEEKSGKTSALKLLLQLISPEKSDVQRMPTEENLALIVSNSFLSAFDNVGKINKPKTDTLIKVCEGGSKTIPAKYKDNVPFTFDLSSIILLAGESSQILDNKAIVQKSILLSLTQPDKKIPFNRLFQDFQKDLPVILGIIFNLLFETLTIYKVKYETCDVIIDDNFTDFTRFGICVCEALNKESAAVGYDFETYNFIESYISVKDEIKYATIYNNPVLRTFLEYIEENIHFSGTAKELNQDLSTFAEDNDMDYPKIENNVLTRKINSNSDALSSLGISIDYKKGSQRIIEVNYEE